MAGPGPSGRSVGGRAQRRRGRAVDAGVAPSLGGEGARRDDGGGAAAALALADEGDEELERLGDRLLRIYLAKGWPREVVEEAVQETLARVWRQGQKVREMWPFAWKVSRRQVATQARRWLMRKRMEGRWEEDGGGSGDEGRTGGEGRLKGGTVAWEEVETTLYGEALGQLLAGMELRQQLVGWLCWVAGADSAAAAAVMGMTREAVRMRLSRLRRRLGQLQLRWEA